MPETQSMKELMFNGGDAVTVFPYGQPLLPNSPVSHRGETTFVREEKKSFYEHHLESTMTFVVMINYIIYYALILEKVQLVLTISIKE